ncbi:hypothetical protein EVAR_70519_1 [Eumeta japonica]|uniref:Uncharacterized protein n=1 Tax=Eumeta variegata TaxID=151549 RepID=A0A4C1T1B2_EUMVA|nr:hypothetical protein EVAR_70519_1 [Eumeta japonica]
MYSNAGHPVGEYIILGVVQYDRHKYIRRLGAYLVTHENPECGVSFPEVPTLKRRAGLRFGVKTAVYKIDPRRCRAPAPAGGRLVLQSSARGEPRASALTCSTRLVAADTC